ncbi:hypothetical protein ACVWCL_21580 [Escherichia coli]
MKRRLIIAASLFVFNLSSGIENFAIKKTINLHFWLSANGLPDDNAKQWHH